MLWRRRRLFASLTALLVGFAVIACACGVSATPAQAASAATVDEHACCKPAESAPAPAAPSEEHEGCPHCGHLSAIPAAAADEVASPALPLGAAIQNASATSHGVAFGTARNVSPLVVSPLDLLSLTCVLRL